MYSNSLRLRCDFRLTAWIGVLVVGAVFAGCQRQRTYAPTYPVRGSVTLDSKPLADGVIAFMSPETGDLQDLKIKDGKYEGPVRPGKRRVEIRAYRPRKGPPKPLEPPPHNYLPNRYNSETTLSADVSPEGPNKFDFELRSQ
jgi:hypothetical protein